MSYDFGCPLCLQICLNISHDERSICVTHVFINNLRSFTMNFVVGCLLSYSDLSTYLYYFDFWIILWTIELELIALSNLWAFLPSCSVHMHYYYCSCHLREMLVFLFHLINLLLVFSWLFNSWSLSAFESEIKSSMMCSLFIRDEESIFEVCNFTSIFFVIIVGRSKYHWIDPIAFLFFWLLYICRFLALKNTKYVQVKFLHICCWSNLYLD